MKKTLIILSLTLVLFLAACSLNKPPVVIVDTPASTSTPDPCSKENLPNEAAKVNNLMREFDDYATLASNTPQAQLSTVIPDLQRVLREAEDQPIPACLETLKKLQLVHMNIVVQTLMAFLSSSDVTVINAGVTQARESHNQYSVEMARLLGVTLAPQPTDPPPPPPPTNTPTP